MAYGTPADPVGGTVITVAYAVANLLDPIRWLRLLTGNGDPPGSSYVVVSTGTGSTSWQRIPTDAIADGAINAAKFAVGAVAAHLGYTPVNDAGDTMTGTLVAPAFQINTGNSIWQWIASGASMFIGIPSVANPLELTQNGVKVTGTLEVGTATVITTDNDGTTCNAASAAAISDGAVSSAAKVVDGILTLAKMAASAADQAAGTASLRSLGTGATQAAAGNHTHAANTQSAAGTYTGNDAGTQFINLGFTPKIVFILNPATGVGIYHNDGNRTTLGYTGNTIVSGSGGITTNGFNAIAGANNASGVTYYYTAIG